VPGISALILVSEIVSDLREKSLPWVHERQVVYIWKVPG